MKALIYIFLFLSYCTPQQPIELAYCDECAFHCCDIFKTCSSIESSCYCIEKTCKNGCCVDGKCGSEEKCNEKSTITLITLIVIIICMSICVIWGSYLCIKRKKKTINTIRNIEEVNNENFVNNNSNNIEDNENCNSGRNTEGILIENVVLGQAMEFFIENKEKNNVLAEGEESIIIKDKI